MITTPVTPLVFLLLVAGCAIWVAFQLLNLGRYFSRDHASVAQSRNDSAILSYYSAGHILARLLKVTGNGVRFSTYLTLPGYMGNTMTSEDAAIQVLDLPYNTQTHVIGLSKQHKIDRIRFARFLREHGMEKVELEGDFPNYFEIYAAQGQQFEVRSVLDPKAMAYVVDYCQAHFWEINSSQMYLVATGNDPEGDNIIDQSLEFATVIKPALLPGNPGAPAVHHETSYGEYDGPALPCPLCQQAMVVNGNYLSCPAGHGVLIMGRDMLRLNEGALQIAADPDKAVAHQAVVCPNCHSQMASNNYDGSKMIIDVCPKCPFRWLDANEVGAVAATHVL